MDKLLGKKNGRIDISQNLADIEKFKYLKIYRREKAARAVEGLSLSIMISKTLSKNAKARAWQKRKNYRSTSFTAVQTK
jgi:signal transduction histidine kinase